MTELSIEERLKRIEDELGLTALDNKKRTRDALIKVYRDYGFTSALAKSYAHSNLNDGITPEEAEKKLLKRGAVKWSH